MIEESICNKCKNLIRLLIRDDKGDIENADYHCVIVGKLALEIISILECSHVRERDDNI